MRDIASDVAGIDDRSSLTQWWFRPNPWNLMRISDGTGVSVDRLREMTLVDWSPIYRDDESNERFSGVHYANRLPTSRTRRFSVCTECLQQDVTSYIRLSWMLGWLAVCPRHATILTERCPRCKAPLRTSYGVAKPFSPDVCSSCTCRTTLLAGKRLPALPCVIRLQAALLACKREGTTDLDGIGRLTWPETVALVDVLLGTFWNGIGSQERQDMVDRRHQELPLHIVAEGGGYYCRYGGLALLAWFLDGWPHALGSRFARRMLARWATARPLRITRYADLRGPDAWDPQNHGLEPWIEARIRGLLRATPR